MKLLLIEADAKLEQELNDFFIAQHYELIKISNGLNALEYINKNSTDIDIVLCDLDEPTIGGLDLIKQVQRSFPKLPFVFLTDADGLHNAIHELHRGAWSYVVKPILNFNTILITIEQLSHQQHLLAANTAYHEELAHKHNELEADHIAGSKLHKQLLPINNVNILNLNFNYFLHPSLYISGDFVDYQKLSERYVVFYLSDVSGHGVSSAFVTVLVKATIQQYISEFIHMNNSTVIDPQNILSILNKLVCQEKLGKYLTMIYMIYDKELSKITYSVAGHYPFPVLIEADKKAEFIGERGYPIGMFKEAKFENYEIKVSNNFKLALFSDGIMDVNPGVDLDAKEQSILDVLTEHHNADLELIKNLLSVDSTASLPDDVCGLLVVGQDRVQIDTTS